MEAVYFTSTLSCCQLLLIVVMSVTDHVFGTSASTSDLYDKVAKDVVISSMQGINGTIFAYGQTGTFISIILFCDYSLVLERGNY